MKERLEQHRQKQNEKLDEMDPLSFMYKDKDS